MSDDLKPCPVCGGKLVRNVSAGQESFSCDACPWFILGTKASR